MKTLIARVIPAGVQLCVAGLIVAASSTADAPASRVRSGELKDARESFAKGEGGS